MKTPDQALTEWVSDEIVIRSGTKKRGKLLVFTKWTLEGILEFLSGEKRCSPWVSTPREILGGVQRNTARRIHRRIAKLKYPKAFTSWWLAQFESFEEVAEYLNTYHPPPPQNRATTSTTATGIATKVGKNPTHKHKEYKAQKAVSGCPIGTRKGIPVNAFQPVPYAKKGVPPPLPGLLFARRGAISPKTTL